MKGTHNCIQALSAFQRKRGTNKLTLFFSFSPSPPRGEYCQMIKNELFSPNSPYLIFYFHTLFFACYNDILLL